MTIDPTTLPEGTVVETRYGETLFTSHGGKRFAASTNRINTDSQTIVGGGDGWLTRVFVPVPEPMTYADAEAALADAGAWVEVSSFADVPEGARLRNDWRNGDSGNDVLYVHRDDLPPADPDAELVEDARLAVAAILADHDRSDSVTSAIARGALSESLAREVVRVVREHEARP